MPVPQLDRAAQEVDIFSFADFDPEGTALTDGLIPQLERFGMRVRGPPKMVVPPSCFTDRELRLFSLPWGCGNGPTYLAFCKPVLRCRYPMLTVDPSRPTIGGKTGTPDRGNRVNTVSHGTLRSNQPGRVNATRLARSIFLFWRLRG